MSLYKGFGAFASSGTAAPGMVLLTPTSITHTGTSASVGANGQVTFTAVSNLSINGVFSADFDNYVVSIEGTGSTSVSTYYRWRAAGTDNSTANSYVDQRILADGSSITGTRFSAANFGQSPFEPRNTQRAGATWHIYNPFLAVPTVNRVLSISDYLGAQIYDTAGTHNQSASYDGFTLITSTGSITGTLQVYGVRS